MNGHTLFDCCSVAIILVLLWENYELRTRIPKRGTNGRFQKK